MVVRQFCLPSQATLCFFSLPRVPSNLHTRPQYPGHLIPDHQQSLISPQPWRACQWSRYHLVAQSRSWKPRRNKISWAGRQTRADVVSEITEQPDNCLRSELKNLSTESFNDFQIETFYLIRSLKRKDRQQQQSLLHQALVTTFRFTAPFTQPLKSQQQGRLQKIQLMQKQLQSSMQQYMQKSVPQQIHQLIQPQMQLPSQQQMQRPVQLQITPQHQLSAPLQSPSPTCMSSPETFTTFQSPMPAMPLSRHLIWVTHPRLVTHFTR